MKLPEMHTYTVHYRNELLEVSEYLCPGHDTSKSTVEASCMCVIAFPRRGVYTRHIGGGQYLADCNQVMFYERDEPYWVEHPTQGGDDNTLLAFVPEHLETLADELGIVLPDPSGRVFSVAQRVKDARIELLHRRLFLAMRHKPVDPLELEELGLEIAARSLELCKDPSSSYVTEAKYLKSGRNRQLVEATKAALNEHLSEPLNLTALARLVASSPFHLSRVFTCNVGLSIHKYLVRLRLNASMEHLSGGADNITQLALEHGFSSHAHYSSSFKSVFGLSPSQFRSGHPFPVPARKLARI